MPTLHVYVHIRKRYLLVIFVLLTLTYLALIYPDIKTFLKRSPPRQQCHRTLPQSLHQLTPSGH